QAETSVTMMVGDRIHDIVGAKANDLSSVGVLYGFGDRQELAKAGAAHIIAQPSELLKLF
ncbi:HAD hydrolase-like protein, partial [Enterococcus faecalis]